MVNRRKYCFVQSRVFFVDERPLSVFLHGNLAAFFFGSQVQMALYTDIQVANTVGPYQTIAWRRHSFDLFFFQNFFLAGH